MAQKAKKETRRCAGLGLCNASRVRLRTGGGVLLGVVLVAIALVRVMDVLASVVLVAVALVNVVDMPRFVPMMLVAVALVNVMNVLSGVVFVLVALVLVVIRSYHSGHLAQDV